ncbi:MAG: AI-2E family transporter [Lachnospiraceae bacterium]|nr:AI-2E family transporter [Lachnospiraceae bacterium]
MESNKGIFSESKKYIKNKENKVELGKYLVIAAIAFLTCCAVIAFFFLIFRYNGLHNAWTKLMNILQPIIIGAVLAYLLNPVMEIVERWSMKLCDRTKMEEHKKKKVSRLAGTAGAIVFLAAIIALLIGMLIPQLVESIQHIMKSLPGDADAFSAWISKYLPEGSAFADKMADYVDMGVRRAQKYIDSEVIPQADMYIANITNGVINIFKTLLNIVIGIIISTYILCSKEHFVGMAKKLIYASCKPKVGNKIVDIVRKSNEIFSGFINGKLLDSAIIGIICYVGCLVMNMPYTLLVAVIVGVTNIIPFFGPYIGAIPCFMLIVMTNPIKGIYFAIFIIILQQIDGNIIGPKILGDSTGLSNVGVIFAILVGGGIFGVPGMVLGVPVFAVLAYVIEEVENYVLRKKKMSQTTSDYVTLVKVDAKSKEMIYENKSKEDA